MAYVSSLAQLTIEKRRKQFDCTLMCRAVATDIHLFNN